MKIIDHAILIPASPTVIWPVISQPVNFSQWQANVSDIRYLNARQNAPGMRWRYQVNRREMVAEVTAWYEGLGYEYVIVDGAPYQNQNQGRIRLQETPEGTVVQWTFNYETSGMLSGLRNSRLHGQLDRFVVASLRNLYAYIRDSGDDALLPSKSLMRDAPDVEERSRYQPRHPSALEDDEILPSADKAEAEEYKRFAPPPEAMPVVPQTPITEPPLADDDTRPNPTVQDKTPEIEEPTFLSEIPDRPFETEAETVDSNKDESVPVEPDLPQPVDLRATDEHEQLTPEHVTPEPIADLPEKPAEIDSPVSGITEPPNDVRDTSQVSIFDVFGLQKPSETQETRSVTPADPAEMETQAAPAQTTTEAASSIEANQPSVATSRTGLRLTLRQQQANVRRP